MPTPNEPVTLHTQTPILVKIIFNFFSLVELIVLNIGLDAGVINDRIFVILVLMALITTFMTSPLIAYVYPSKYQLSKGRSTSTMRKVRPLALTWPTVDDKILVYLKDIDSVPLMANILQMFKVSLAPGKTIHLNGLKAYTDLERSSTIMASTQVIYQASAHKICYRLKMLLKMTQQ
jgi:hypothetical protein